MTMAVLENLVAKPNPLPNPIPYHEKNEQVTKFEGGKGGRLRVKPMDGQWLMQQRTVAMHRLARG
jgi:hypothetical protein